MKIETSKGKTHEIRVICTMATNKSRALIELEDNRPLHEIILDFDGLDTIKKDMGRGVHEEYSGFNRLVGISRVKGESDVVRITLERNDADD